MSQAQLRTKTEIPCIYYNHKTGSYDVKCNYSERSQHTNQISYRSKWSYNLPSLELAKDELRRLKAVYVSPASHAKTLVDAYKLWEKTAQELRFRPKAYKGHQKPQGKTDSLGQTDTVAFYSLS